ncbi:DNA polymerase-3 subunit gamma/tau [Paenibacillus sp. UNCCL117]|uniref:DNA polymerase III subunit gamma/tau n=1 Tax=unclassified Paenibacillus TaxID=185978 RepID=UPI00088502C4|nr:MULTISPECIES: DNA polymerase III subunit gamma/tau [unclassified Paenibacillus]SDD19546.1 DNA polymerase-3 subunit gamma/tau [Paenibacillus sp. cl123]SFW35570.1 DNA polymerase-3 subunit gamma/tau [Paenibacillus sp. UNCCL117]
MAHIALYRTWRPQSFQDMVGQKHIVQTLQNSLREGRFSHAYLFSGPRGTGKTSAAKILAKAVNCQNGPGIEPCNRCEACRRITDGSVMDVVEIDAASNRGVEEIRDIRDKVKYAPTEVRQKVYIIDEVHMLTTEAFNALLKTLEEPPAHVMFILATTEPHRLPATIISRCQRFDFRRVALEEQAERLRRVCGEEGIAIDEEAVAFIARLSDGGMRDALSLLDQIIAFSGEKITYEDVLSITGGMASDQFEKLARVIQDRDIGAALKLIDAFMQEGKSADKCMENLIYYFRDLLMVRMVPNSEALTERILDIRRFTAVAEGFAPEALISMIDTLNYYQTEMKYSVQPQTLLEVAVMKLCSGGGAPGRAGQPAGGPEAAAASPAGGGERQDALVAQLLGRIERLEGQLAAIVKQGGVPAANTPGTGGAAARPSAAQTAASSRKTLEKADAYIAGRETPEFREAAQRWSQVLGRVKDLKITVHAWLVDGEPVARADSNLLVAFKSAMHRETSERPANKQLIEQAMQEVLGHPYRLVTVMLKDWQAAAEGSKQPEAPKEELQLVAEEEPGGPVKEEWINEAIQLFGEDLVKIKDE